MRSNFYMSHFTYDLLAADAVALAERLTLEELELDLHHESTERNTVMDPSSYLRTADYGMRVITHTNFIIPLLQHAIAARKGCVNSQAWLDSLKINN